MLVLSAGRELPEDRPLMIDWLQRAAERRPHVTFLAERRGPDRAWQRLTYAEAWAKTGAVASWLIAQGYGPDSITGRDPVGQQPGERAVPVRRDARGPAGGADIAQLFAVRRFRAPRSGARSRAAGFGVRAGLGRLRQGARSHERADHHRRRHKRGLPFGALTSASIDAAVAERRKTITADTPAKIMFTSGSTGTAKGVLNTHGNLASAIEMIRMVGEPLDPNRIGLSLDWLPWHHTWGGNSNLNGAVRVAGSLYIDGGRPVPGRFQETLENLRELSPSSFGNVPAAYPLLLEALERDADLRAKFFKNMRGLGYGGALLPQESFDRLQSVATGQLSERLPFTCGWGMTETTSTGLMVYWNVDRAGSAGPAAARHAGQAGAGRRPLRAAREGPEHHAGLLAQSRSDRRGVRRGRLLQDRRRRALGRREPARSRHRLRRPPVGGVQARVGHLGARHDLAHAADRRAAALCARPGDRGTRQAVARRAGLARRKCLSRATHWRPALERLLHAFNDRAGGSSMRIQRLLPLAEPPNAGAGEITDKRSINTRRVLERRAAEVARLYAEPADPAVVR